MVTEPKYKCLKCGAEYTFTTEDVSELFNESEIPCTACGSLNMMRLDAPKRKEIDLDQLEEDITEAYNELK